VPPHFEPIAASAVEPQVEATEEAADLGRAMPFGKEAESAATTSAWGPGSAEPAEPGRESPADAGRENPADEGREAARVPMVVEWDRPTHRPLEPPQLLTVRSVGADAGRASGGSEPARTLYVRRLPVGVTCSVRMEPRMRPPMLSAPKLSLGLAVNGLL